MGPVEPDASERPGTHVHLVDGGDKACGELLMGLVRPMRRLEVGEIVRLVAIDPAAPLDIPAWCHLTGHRYLGPGVQPDGRAHYDLEVAADARRVHPDRPWRAATRGSSNPLTDERNRA